VAAILNFDYIIDIFILIPIYYLMTMYKQALFPKVQNCHKI